MPEMRQTRNLWKSSRQASSRRVNCDFMAHRHPAINRLMVPENPLIPPLARLRFHYV